LAEIPRCPGRRPVLRSDEMAYAIVGQPVDGPLGDFVGALRVALERRGFESRPAQDAVLVLNVVDPSRPRPFRRRARGTFVAALHVLEESPPDPLREGYPVLVRALANVSLAYVPGEGVWFTTLERGSYLVRTADEVAARLEPLARSRLVIDTSSTPTSSRSSGAATRSRAPSRT